MRTRMLLILLAVASAVALVEMGVFRASDARRDAPPDGVPSASDTSSGDGTDGTATRPATKKARKPVGSEGWRISRPASGQIEGYTTRASGPPGTQLGLKVSTSRGRYRAHAYRIGAYRRGTSTLVWSSSTLPGELQPEGKFRPYRTRTMVAPWRRSMTVDTTGWDPGFYVFRLQTGSGLETQIPYIVSTPTAEGTVALVFPVTTWQAYNIWGGHSLYDGPADDQRAYAVSFDRPYSGVLGFNDFRTAVIPAVVRAESTGVALSYYANVDLHDRDVLAGARGYVSVGHDEYWTLGIRQTVLRARAAGTNLAFLGANTMYWRVRLDDRNTGPKRLMTGYRDNAWDDPLRETKPREATSRYRDGPVALPENDLTGMLYECYPVDAPYRIVTPRWWGFVGTGVRRGSVIPGLVGGESDRVYPNRRTPRPMQILSHTSFSCRGVPTTAQAVYYTTRSGAAVFNAGTLRWGCALAERCDEPLGRRTRKFTRAVTANVLRAFATGPMGERRPARDNVDDFDLPLTNSVEAS